jgi:hypothetical protein
LFSGYYSLLSPARPSHFLIVPGRLKLERGNNTSMDYSTVNFVVYKEHLKIIIKKL